MVIICNNNNKLNQYVTGENLYTYLPIYFAWERYLLYYSIYKCKNPLNVLCS